MNLLILATLYTAFAHPADSVKPWAYWLWENSHVDRETIVEDVAAIRNLGFGAVLMSDSRGYWDDERHVVKPAPLHVWGSESWLDLVAEAIRECHRRRLGFTMNVAASGGKLNGEVEVGNDAPKVLVVKRCRPGERTALPPTPYCGTVATFAVRTADPVAQTDWLNAGDGFYSMSATSGRRADGQADVSRHAALEVRELAADDDGAALGAEWTVLRFAWRTIPKHEKDIDVLDPQAVRRHLDRVLLPLFRRIPGLYGKDRTFTHLYSVSWEGAMPTWSPTFERDFARFAGRPLRPLLPVLAGFDLPDVPTEDVMRDFRRARGEMMRKNFYATMREYAHGKGMLCYAESGGPWIRRPQVFGECDQTGFLSEMDVPQGEFWPVSENRVSEETGFANKNLRSLTRGQVSTAHVFGKRIVSVEAFTHMHRHWSADPQYLKPLADQVFADGVNRLVWHTYTSSPARFGVPGLEFFAGTHINRNVTWHRELPPFVAYLARCQALLQEGEPVTDIAVLVGNRAYAHWGRFRDRVSDETPVGIPEGYAFDALSDEALANDPTLTSRYPIVYDARDPKSHHRTIPAGTLLPDAFGPFTWCHRRNAEADWYFVAGEGAFDAVFRCTSPQPEVWDAVTGRRELAVAERLSDGRTKVSLALPKAGSCFVVFPKTASEGLPMPLRDAGGPLAVKGPWNVSFAYHPGVSATPPVARTMDELVDFTTVDDLRHFSGTASYRASFDLAEKEAGATYRLCPALFMTGLCRVLLNGVDCGVIWCDPWRIDVTAAIRPGTNDLEIRYVNNWCNRLVGDCALPAEKRVTKSVLRYWDVPRSRAADGSFALTPTVYSGYSKDDPLQHCGLVGEVCVRKFK